MGDSGTIIPSGTWSSSVPVVAQGKYLWTREITQFNTGNPIIKYSVSRFGIDGTGAVSTVAGVSPDSNGNVPLDAASVKALALSGGTMEGPINMNGRGLFGLNAPRSDDEAATKGYVDTNKVAKSNVVNNFTTTQSGFVADARTVKDLNDNKLSMELLWENPRPNSEMTEGTVLVATDGYCGVDIDFQHLAPEGLYSTHRMYFDGVQHEMIAANGDGKYTSRKVNKSADGIYFGKGYLYPSYGSFQGNQLAMIPFRIYGIKGGTV
jgi:hypothetical protein